MRSVTPRAKFGFLVHDISRMRRTYFDQALRPWGITRAQWWALGNISRHADSGMIQTELAEILEMGKVSVGGLIDKLEEANLVYRQVDKVDRRVKRVFITDKGFEMLGRISVVGERLDHELYLDLPDGEINATVNVMSRIKDNIRKALSKPIPVVSAAEVKGAAKSSSAGPRKRARGRAVGAVG